MRHATGRMILILLVAIGAGLVVSSAAVLIQVTIDRTNQHFETLDATLDQ